MAAPRAVLGRTSVQTTAGLALEGASVYVYEDDGTTLFSQPMYSASSGGTLLANPFLSGANGAISCFTTKPKTCIVKVNGVSAPSEFVADPEFGQSGMGPNTGVSVAWAGADLTGTLSAATALQTALDTALAQKADIWFPAGLYNFSTANFSIPTTYNGIRFRLDYGAILQCRDTGTTFSIAANSFKINGGQITRKGATASDWTCTPINVSGDDFEAEGVHFYNLGGIPIYTTGARPKVTHNFFEETGLLNRSNLTKIGHPLPDPDYANLHDPVGSGVYLNGNTHGTVAENVFKGTGGPTININAGGSHIVSHNHFIGGAKTSTISVTTTQAGDGTHNEIQRVSITSTCKTGSFYLAFTNPSAVSGSTGYLPIDYSATALGQDLQLLASIGIGNVSVAGGFPNWDVEFIGALGHTNVALMTTSDDTLDYQENCIYDTGSTASLFSNNVFKNFANEAVYLGGAESPVIGNTFANDATAIRSRGVSFNNIGPWICNGNTFDGTHIGAAATVSTASASIVCSGNTFNGSLFDIQQNVTGLTFSNNECVGGFYLQADATKTLSLIHISDCVFRGFAIANNTNGNLLDIGSATVTNCDFSITTCNGIFSRLGIGNKDVTVSDCRLIGDVSGVKAIMYGNDYSNPPTNSIPMTGAEGNGWKFIDCDFSTVAMTLSKYTALPLTVALPLRMGEANNDFSYTLDAAPDGAAAVTFGPWSATSAVHAVSIKAEITGRVGNNAQTALVEAIKANNVPVIKYTAGVNATGVVFTAGGGDFTAGGSGNETLSLIYTNPNAPGTAVRLTARVKVQYR